jgi:hypothetical protein
MIYTVVMTNFGSQIYSGSDLARARECARATGFECAVFFTKNSETVLFAEYSPISGWR